MKTLARAVALAVAASLVSGGVGGGGEHRRHRRPVHQRLGPTGQHATAVEPDTFAFGSTLVVTSRSAASSTAAPPAPPSRPPPTAARPSRPGCCPASAPDSGRPLQPHDRPGRRLRRQAQRLDDLLARPDGPRPGGAAVVVNRSTDGGAHLGRARHGGERRTGAGLRQELGRVRQHQHEPALRQLLPRVGRLRRRRPHPDEHVERRRPHMERADHDRRSACTAWAASRWSSRTAT